MNPAGKKHLTLTVVFAALIFVWIGLAVLLTGGRDVGEFTAQDSLVMTGFLFAEVLTVVLTFIFALRAGKANRGNAPQPELPPQTKTQKIIRSRKVFRLALSMGLAYLLFLAGTAVGMPRSTAGVMVLGMLALWAALLLGNILLYRGYKKRMQAQDVRQMQSFLLSHRDSAEETAREKLAVLRKWLRRTNVYALGILLCGMVLAFGLGALQIPYTLIFAVPGLLITAFALRIRSAAPKSIFEDDNTYLAEEDYPRLHQLARKAADALGCGNRIRIAVTGNSNAGIAKIGDVCSVQLGVILLQTLSEEELYNILLHEFSHVTQESTAAQKERQHYEWLVGTEPASLYERFGALMFRYPDTRYAVEYFLYQYASSIQTEATADRTMAEKGSPAAAASALVKLFYYDVFCWEKGGVDEENVYQAESPRGDLLTAELENFRQAMADGTARWNELLKKEILARNASHPTIKMRLDALGAAQVQALPRSVSPEHQAECDKALAYADSLVRKKLEKNYGEARKARYLEPKAAVEAWEQAGKPLVPEEYGDIVWHLRSLGRTADALALCQRAIAQLTPIAASQAYLIRGMYQLYRYDPAGLEDIYFAIAQNKNYIDEGLEVIGPFCCLTGNQAELEVYREKALELAQEDKDIYSQVGTLRGRDRLTPEKLPEGMLEGILSFIATVSDGNIQRVYLVRKTITESFFTSAVVVQFVPEAEEEAVDEILHKIFRYLDTSTDWQFSLFDYRDVKDVRVERIENSCVYEK